MDRFAILQSYHPQYAWRYFTRADDGTPVPYSPIRLRLAPKRRGYHHRAPRNVYIGPFT
jgi:hypothetical protein